MNALAQRLGKAIESSGVEIHPAPLVVIAVPGDQQDLSAENSGFCHHVATRFNHQLWRRTAKMAADRSRDRLDVVRERRHRRAVKRRQTTADVQQIENHALALTEVENACGVANGRRPLHWIGVLGTDMEGGADWAQPKRLGMQQQLDGELASSRTSW
jgi:hypothetical protein